MRIQLEGDKLLRVLALTTHEVKILEGQRVIDRVSHAEAFRMARAGDYIGSGTETRVKSIRRLRPAPRWQPSYRTEQAPAIGPWAGGAPDWHRTYQTQP